MNKLVFFVVLSVLGLAISCNKQTEGCTDPEADNYNAQAELDDGSCTYAAETSPCGEGINFCFDYNGETKSGMAILTKHNSEWDIAWDGDTTISEYAGMIFIGDTAGVYHRDSIDMNEVHFYFHDTQGGYQSAHTGSMNITVFDSVAGLEGTFAFELNGGASVTNGHIFKLAK